MPYTIKCDICQKNFKHNQPRIKTCSKKCHEERMSNLYGRYSLGSLSTATVGTISEFAVTIDLLKKGYAVFKAVSHNCYCDLIASKNFKTYQIEVKTGYKSRVTGKILGPTRFQNKFEILAIYVRKENEIFYFDEKVKPIKFD